MTSVDRPAFFTTFRKVARTFNKKITDDVCTDYFDALEAVPIDEIEAAADTLVKTSRYWPKPVDWLEAAQRSQKHGREFTRFTPPVVMPDGTTETTFHCVQCRDTGWRPGCGCELGRLDLTKRCPEHPYSRHDMPYPEPLKACACRDSNQVWQANHPRKYVKPGSEKERY